MTEIQYGSNQMTINAWLQVVLVQVVQKMAMKLLLTLHT